MPNKTTPITKADLLKVNNDAKEAALDAGSKKADAEEAGKKATTAKYYSSMGEEVLMADINKVPLQRWHHMVLAYNNGVFDIFLNGVLYRSIPGVMTDTFGSSLTVGTTDGNSGKICNMVFYQGGTDAVASFTKNGNAISADKVTSLYNTFA